MRQLVKDAVALFIDFSGLNKLLLHRYNHRVLILTYHGVLPACYIENGENSVFYSNVVTQKAFEQQMRYLKLNFQPLTLVDLDKTLEAKTNPVKKPYVIVTFDDGYENTFNYALPILKKYGIIGHFFISTDFIGTKNFIWTEEIKYRLQKTEVMKISFKLDGKNYSFPLQSIRNKEKSSKLIRHILKYSSKKDVLATINAIRSQTRDVDISSRSVKRYNHLNWKQIRELSDSRMIIGSHTTDHFILSSLTKEESYASIANSKRVIEKNTSKACKYFSYPNGTIRDFGMRDINILKGLTFKYALSQIYGTNNWNYILTNKFILKRINITNLMSMPVFRAVVSGAWSKITLRCLYK